MNRLDDDEIIDFDLDANADSFEMPKNPLSRKIPVTQEEELTDDEEEFLDEDDDFLDDDFLDDEDPYQDEEPIYDISPDSDALNEETPNDTASDRKLFGSEFGEEFFDESFADESLENYSDEDDLFYDDLEESLNKKIPKKTFQFKKFRSEDYGADEEEEIDQESIFYNDSSKKSIKHFSRSTEQRQTYRSMSILTWILAFTTLCSVGLCVYLLIDAHNKATSVHSVIIERPPLQYTQEEIDMMMEEAADLREQEIKLEMQDHLAVPSPNVAEMLRQLYSDHVIYYDSEGYHFIPLPASIERNNLDRNNFVLSEDGEITYMEQDTVVSLKGIDVSQHQGSIDWEQVAASGVDFAMIRAGYRGYGSGVLVTDERFEENITGALNAGLPVGAYFFTQAVTVEEAEEEASYITQLLSPYDITYPVVIDVEKPDSDDARANSLSQEERTAIVCAFCRAIEGAGYTPMIYGNTQSLFGMLDIEQISEYEIWHAFYNDYAYYPFQLRMWQYTAGATVPGVEGAVDLNIWLPENIQSASSSQDAGEDMQNNGEDTQNNDEDIQDSQ